MVNAPSHQNARVTSCCIHLVHRNKATYIGHSKNETNEALTPVVETPHNVERESQERSIKIVSPRSACRKTKNI